MALPEKSRVAPGPSGLYCQSPPYRAPLPEGGETGGSQAGGAGPPSTSPPGPAQLEVYRLGVGFCYTCVASVYLSILEHFVTIAHNGVGCSRNDSEYYYDIFSALIANVFIVMTIRDFTTVAAVRGNVQPVELSAERSVERLAVWLAEQSAERSAVCGVQVGLRPTSW